MSSVTVVNTPVQPIPVIVENVATLPVPTLVVNEIVVLEQRARTPIQKGVANGTTFSFAVPAGRRLVIEFLALSVLGNVAGFRIDLTMGGSPGFHILENFGGALVVKLYADPGTTVTFTTTNGAQANMSMCGYLETI